MKVIILDQYEFESPGSEQSLVIAMATSNQFQDLMAFFKATEETDCFVSCGEPLKTEKTVFKNYQYSSSVRYHLERFVRRMPSTDACVTEIEDEWNIREILIESKGTFIRYAWETSA